MFFLFIIFSIGGIFFAFQIHLFLARKTNPLIRSLCKKPINKNDKGCFSIILSKRSWVTKNTHLGDIAIVYFIGQLIFLIFMAVDKEALEALQLLFVPGSILALVAFFLIAYQRIYFTGWCQLCLIIISIIWIQEILLVLYVNKNNLLKQSLNLSNYNQYKTGLTHFLISYMIGMLWLFVSPLLRKGMNANIIVEQLNKWKRSSTLFVNILKDQWKIKVETYEEDYALGNNNAQWKIHLILTPYCPSCKEAYRILSLLLIRRQVDIHLIIRFNVDATKKDKYSLAAAYLMHLFQDPQVKDKTQILLEWFEYKNLPNFEKNPTIWEQGQKLLARHSHWCFENYIQQAPVIFINGFFFPEPFNFKDLSYHLMMLKKHPELLSTRL